MIILLPPQVTNFFNIIEILIYFHGQIENQLFHNYKDEFSYFLEKLEEDIIDDWEFTKTTLPIDKNTLNSIEKQIKELPNLRQEIEENLKDLSPQKIDIPIVENIIKKVIKIIDINNNIAAVLKNQKLLSPYPVIDKFLKIFWIYVENIKNLEKFPISLLVKYLFGTQKLVEEIEKKINLEKEILNNDKDNEQIKKILEEQSVLVEAQKYALGAAFLLINGEIDLIEDPQIPYKIFTQINQATNTLFALENAKSQKVNLKQLLASISNYNEEQKKFIINSIKNIVLNILFSPYFINNIENIENLDKIIELLQKITTEIQNLEEYITQNLELMISILDTANNNFNTFNQEDKNIKEILNSFTLFVLLNLPLSTFVNILSNIKNTLKIYSILIKHKINSINELFQDIDNMISLSIHYSIYHENLEELYYIFVNFINKFKLIYKEIKELSNQKIICPLCKTENEFLAQKCTNCNFSFPISTEKLIIINLINNPIILQNYILNLIENYLINNDIENTINQLEYTIKELENIKKYSKQNESEQLQIVFQIEEILKNIKEKVENQEEKDLVLEEILKLLEKSQFLKSIFEEINN